LHSRDANANHSRKVDRLKRIESDVTADVRAGELTPKEGAEIIAEHRAKG